jgi:PKD repeat protein
VDIDGELWANPPSIGCDEYLSDSAIGALGAAFTISYTNVAVGFSVNLESVIGGRLSASSWDFGDGVVVSNRPYASHAWATTGNYAVTLRAYNNDYPGGVAATALVHVVTQPVHYVVTGSSSPSAPYSFWSSAATNIQDAVDAATVPGALVLVSNGVYQTGARAVSGISNRVAVTKPVTVRSVNGPAVTRIVGYRVPTFVFGSAAIRCVYLTNGATLAGFTLTNGATQASGDQSRQSGGGVYCELANTVVSNCVLTGNTAASRGGGACFGALNNCILTNNNAGSGGGACFATLANCTLVGNTGNSYGGGEYYCALTQCLLRTNYASYGGGAYYGKLDGCTLTNNSAASGGGAWSGAFNNCAFISNSASAYSPYGGGAYNSTLNNCTVSGNTAAGTLPYAGGLYLGSANNCILYFNSASNGANYYFPGQTLANYSCTTPDPGGVGNITNAPLFANFAGNLRLQSTSPCINSGNNTRVIGSTDLDGNTRIMSGTVDMGAYEFQGAGSVISYAWLQQFGLAIDGSADFSDFDHDGLNNWQEWLAGTNPTNALSVLKISSATLMNNAAGFVVSWESQNTRTYYLQRSRDLTQPAFVTIQDNISGQAGTTSYTDTNAVDTGPFFYRVGIKSP